MKNIVNKLFLVAIAGSLLSSCKPEQSIPKPSAGSLKLNNGQASNTAYVAMGNSLTAGFQNGGLYYAGQVSSYANVLAEQLKLVEPSLVFNTPFLPASSIGYGQPNASVTGSGLSTTITIKIPAPLVLQTQTNCKGESGLSPYQAPKGDSTLLGTTNGAPLSIISVISGGGPLPASMYATGNGTASAGPYQNMGVPGARCIDVNIAGYGGSNLIQSVNVGTQSVVQSNPFFSRFAKNQSTSSMLSDALLSKPTFFTLFIGNNDVLLWASGGGVNGLGSTSITPVPQFQDSITNIVNTLLTTATQGIIINIPQITGAAFFNYNKPYYVGTNGVDSAYWIIDETGAPRQMASNELVLLTVPQDSVLCYWLGHSQAHPLSKKYTLTANQVTEVTNAINSYNTILQDQATTNNLTYFDMNAFVAENAAGSQYNGMALTGTFVTGGIFGLDGVHLTPRGYALLGNKLIEVINAKYGATIPGVDVTKLNGVIFPN